LQLLQVVTWFDLANSLINSRATSPEMIVLLVAAVGLVVLTFVGYKFWTKRQQAAAEEAKRAAAQA
jgi:threonine/homoserine/homoserine lactone efflux protein